MISVRKLLLSLLLAELVGDGVSDRRARASVYDGIPERNLQEARNHQHQVRRVAEGDCNTPIILCCTEK